MTHDTRNLTQHTLFFLFKKIIGATIRTSREIQCLPYVGFIGLGAKTIQVGKYFSLPGHFLKHIQGIAFEQVKVKIHILLTVPV